MLNESSLNRKGLQSGSIFALILLTTSLLSTSYVQNSKALQEDHEDYGYLKFASYAVKQAYAAKQNSTVNSTIHIPAIAMGPQIPTKGYLVQEIRDHLYWVTDGAYNTMFLVSNQGVIVVDAPFTIGKNYLKAIRSEEHTSELQSHSDLVCRLLLEKKKKKKKRYLLNLQIQRLR